MDHTTRKLLAEMPRNMIPVSSNINEEYNAILLELKKTIVLLLLNLYE